MKNIKIRFWNGKEMFYRSLFNIESNTSYIGEPMLFTGLFDKHKKEIYEGDLLKLPSGVVGEVVYHTERSGYIFHCKNFYNEMLYQKSIIEVIGNIYENSELL